MIDVIIPAYNAHGYIKKALTSLSLQTFRDKISVCIVNDCSKKDYSEDIENFKDILKIKELTLNKKMSFGYARQYGIDHTDSEYIVFLDAYDLLFDCFAIESIYSYISENNYNVVCSNFTEVCGQCSYFNHFVDHKWLYGKIYRRKFLLDNNIKFNNTISNENVGFNALIYMLTDIGYLDRFTYIWFNNDNSIIRRKNRKFDITGLPDFVYNICFAIDEAEKRNISKSIIGKIAFEAMVEIYYTYVKYKKKDTEKSILNGIDKLRKVYKKYKKYIFDVDMREVLKMELDDVLMLLGPEGFMNMKISFNDFLNNKPTSQDCLK